MANVVSNIGKGRVAHAASLDLGVLLLRNAQSDAAIVDHLSIADMLGNASNDEANFTNYARKTPLTASVTIDNVNDRVDISIPNQTWSSAGGATNNSLAKLLVYWETGGSDATRTPLTYHDFVATTNGNDLVAQFAPAGFYRAQAA